MRSNGSNNTIQCLYFLFIFSFSTITAFSQEKEPENILEKMKRESRVALVIGNSNYKNRNVQTLPNPIVDAD